MSLFIKIHLSLQNKNFEVSFLMRVTARLIRLTVKALCESMDVETMVVIIKKLVPNYNLNQRVGFAEVIPVPNRDAANQIVHDLKDMDFFLQFISLLTDIQENGLIGRKYKISYLHLILEEIYKAGFIYDKKYRIFVEDPRIRKTRNWGFLREGHEYIFSFIYLDIVDNSTLFSQYPIDIIQATHIDLRNIVQYAIERRNGRIWSWEGDGGMGVFFFNNKELNATLSCMEIIHELLIYNHTRSRLKRPMELRIAVHTGSCVYMNDNEYINKSEIKKKLIEIESKYCSPNTITITQLVYSSLDHFITNQFQFIEKEGKSKMYNYKLKWEE